MDEMFSNSLEDHSAAEGGAMMAQQEGGYDDDRMAAGDQEPPAPKRKVVLDDFQLLKVIGKGSFGKVLQRVDDVCWSWCSYCDTNLHCRLCLFAKRTMG